MKNHERLVSKMEGKTNFSRRLKQFDGLTCLALTPPPYLTTDLRHCQSNTSAVTHLVGLAYTVSVRAIGRGGHGQLCTGAVVTARHGDELLQSTTSGYVLSA